MFQRVLERAAERGYTAHFSAEYEFFIFRETAQSLRDKHFTGLTPLTPGMFGYSVLRASANADLVLEILEALAAFDVPLEGFHTETGPGVYEAAIAVEPGLAAADRAALFKTAVKEIAARHSLTPTFMAKWNAELPGSSGHLHQSLSPVGNHENLFSPATEAGMSDLMRQYIAGLVANMPELTAIFCPTINSYKRTVPGAWAPVNATWGVDNRTTAVRAIPGQQQIHARGTAAHRRGHQSVPGDGRLARGGFGRHRAQAGASAAHGECVLPETRRRCRARWPRPRACSARAAWRANGWARSSWITTRARANGKCANTRRRSPTGNWRATSSQSDHVPCVRFVQRVSPADRRRAGNHRQ